MAGWAREGEAKRGALPSVERMSLSWESVTVPTWPERLPEGDEAGGESQSAGCLRDLGTHEGDYEF